MSDHFEPGERTSDKPITDESRAAAPLQHIVDANAYSPRTIRQYRSTIRTIERAHRDSSVPPDCQGEMDYDDSPPELARFAVGLLQSGELSLSTARLYRAALIWHFSQLLNIVPGADMAWSLMQDFKLGDIELERVANGPRKRKSIRKSTLDELVEILIHKGGAGIQTAKWIRATVAAGLRPSEWASAELEGHVLRVKSAKKPRKLPTLARIRAAEEISGRKIDSVYEANQVLYDKFGEIPDWSPQNESRALDLHGDDIDAVAAHLRALNEAAEAGVAFTTYYDTCRKALARACKELPGQPAYSLYTLRHQFSSNVRASRSAADAAALLGHELQSDGNQRKTRIYGKRGWAHAGGQRPTVHREVENSSTAEGATAPAESGAPTASQDCGGAG